MGPTREVSSSCMEYLVMEMVSQLLKVSYREHTSDREDLSVDSSVSEKSEVSFTDEDCTSLLNTFGQSSNVNGIDSIQDILYGKLEQVGFRVGQRLIEKYTKDRPLFVDHMEIVKFMCKDFWIEVFKKQVDTLKTNHKGVFVLRDNKFRYLTQVSAEPMTVSKPVATHDSTHAVDDPTTNFPPESIFYTWFACGVIRGALSNLGISCTVSSAIPQLPVCVFTIKLNKL